MGSLCFKRQENDSVSNASTGATPAWRSEYPFESNYLQLDQVRMHYVDEGPPSSESSLGPVLMVHGNPTWSFYYRHLVQSLKNRRRAIAIDHIGCGLSDKPTEYDYCLQQHIDNLCHLVDELDLSNVTLVAHDWGGAIGLGTLLARQERFRRIVLLNTGAFPPPYIPFRIRVCRWPVIGKVGLQGFNLFAKAAVTMATERPGGLPANVAAGMLAPYDNWSNRIATYQFVKDIPLSKSHRTWSVLDSIESQLSELTAMPKLLMWGMKDWCFRPECLDRFVTHWPDAEVHRYDDGGHYVLEDKRDQILPAVSEFLDRHEA